MRPHRLFAVLAVLALVGLFWSVPHPASAASVIAPDAPRPINVLPSTAAAIRSTGIAAPAATQAWVYYLYSAAKTPEFWQAVNAQKAGTATAGQLTLIQQGADDFKVPATKAAKMLKVAGGVGVAVAGLEVGGMMGNGALELFGFDVDGTVCPNTGTDPIGLVAQWASNADCDAWQPDPGFIANEGLANRPAGWWSDVVSNQGTTKITHQYLTSSVVGSTFTATGRVTQLTNNISNFNLNVFCWDGSGNTANDYSVVSATQAQHVHLPSGAGAWTLAQVAANPDIRTQIPCPNGRQPYAFAAKIDIPNGTHPDALINRPPQTGYDSGAIWYSTLSPNWQPEEVADPERRLVCEVEASNGQTYTGQTEPFFESSMRFPAPVCPVLPPEVYPERIKVDETGGGQIAELYNEPTTPEYQQFQQTFPDCDSGTCMLDLLKNNTSCFQTPADCLDWFSDPNKSSTYSCTYGSVAVDLAECNVYAPSFTSDPSAGTQYGDPTTGQPLPSTVPNTRDAQYSNGSVADPSQPRQCMPTGWGVLNPIEWVLRPVQCALEWAFVPRQSVIEAQFGTLLPLYVDTMPGQLHLAVSDWSFTAPPTNCNGITLDMSWIPGQTSVQMLNACPGDPLHPFAGWAKFFFYVAFTVVGTLGSIRNAAATIGYRGIGGDS